MKRFMYFCLGLAIATALLISSGCASSMQNSILEGMMGELGGPQFEENWEPVREEGWQPADQNGNHWDLYAPIGGELHLIATCDYRYFKVDGIEKWKGRYFGMTDAMNFHDPISNNNLDNLVGCVDWVKKFYYGDYSI